MRKFTSIFSSLAVAALLLIPGSVFAATAATTTGTSAPATQELSLDQAIQNILTAQHVQRLQDIDCSKVTDAQFIAVGDGLMGEMHPEQNVHQQMDNMMGGEGSSSLDQAHIAMGSRYLGCSGNSNYAGGYGMMGGNYGGWGMMGSSYGGYGMMGGYGPGYGSPRTMGNGWGMMGGWQGESWMGLVSTILLWVFLGLGIAWFIKHLRDGKKH